MLEAEEAARHLDWMKLVMGGGKAIASGNGYYDGRFIAPGYIVDRSDPKRKKYIIYEPHAKVVKWLFHRFLELDGNIWELCREIEKMPFLFPKFEDWIDPKNVSKFAAGGHKRSSLIKEGPYAGNYKSTIYGVRYILCNPVYIGWWLPINGGVIENNHDSIIDETLFTYAHKRLSNYDLNGERRKPERVTRPGEAKGILKKVLHDDRNQRMYASLGPRHGGKEFTYYQSNEKSGLSSKFRYAADVQLIDTVFLEKFLERIEALKKLDDWKDKQEERLAEITAAQAYNKSLIQKQIKDAQARWQEMFDTLHDHEIPKTKQMKIEYANQMAGLEGKIAEWENKLEAPEDEDEEVTLYEIHSLLPDITSKWDKLSFEVRLRFVGAVTRKVVLWQVAPTWLKIDIHWKEAIGNFIDTGHFKRKYSNKTRWTPEEEAILHEMYPKADGAEILAALPDRSWVSIMHRADRLYIDRERNTHNSIPTSAKNYGTLEDKEYEKEHRLSPNSKNVQWSLSEPPCMVVRSLR
ncbi:hypothetical protein KSF_052600 [Reticulibacter mediterranei]|uniref:Recombinase domain-containing protein n=1 Tax=Reticulibacter mediterranei TaxID=2778369 RepID=A0A8J3N290_9CHLR|nr:recombinase family protein [Reticulibacter mediterranei]GHO95212.1 hypothetical protein KSF_052600 [Reticulibacter mediterranei]